MDWFKLINCMELRNEKSMSQFIALDIELAKKQMASYYNTWEYGFISIYLILLRLPIFWIFIPILYILKITKLGDYIYKELAIKRKIIPIHCDNKSCEINYE